MSPPCVRESVVGQVMNKQIAAGWEHLLIDSLFHVQTDSRGAVHAQLEGQTAKTVCKSCNITATLAVILLEDFTSRNHEEGQQ